MGYTHYWFRSKELSPDLFARAALDCATITHSIRTALAGARGAGDPAFDFEIVAFNGVEDCGHPVQTLGIAWPEKGAKGIADFDEQVGTGSWFGGAKLTKRTCDGDCSHETFWIPRLMPDEETEDRYEGDLFFHFCKTAFKPYDLTVQCCLIIFSHYLREQFLVLSDGDSDQWNEARGICQTTLGFGKDFMLSEMPKKMCRDNEEPA
jgi:hypothetical protein